jgi:hypothetical protein
VLVQEWRLRTGGRIIPLPRSLNRCPGRLFTCGGQRERRAAHSLRADVCGVLLRLSPSQLRDGDGHQSEGFGAWLAA